MRYRKMFGEYMIYVNEKPILLVCDNTVYAKMLPGLEELCSGCEVGVPYKGANDHYIIDVDNAEYAREITKVLESLTPMPKPKKKR